MPCQPLILLTRPAPQADAFAADLRARGVDTQILIAPLIRIEPERFVLPDPRPGDLFLVTSANALLALDRASLPARARAICVGAGVSEAALEAGFDAVMGGESLEELAGNLAGRAPAHQRLIHLRGEHVSADIAAVLPTPPGGHLAVMTYRQIRLQFDADCRDRLARAECILVPLFSPRTARILADAFDPSLAARTQAICISRNTAQMIESIKFSSIQTARAPTREAMLDLVRAAQAACLRLSPVTRAR